MTEAAQSGPGGFARRNKLLQIEKEIQELWERDNAYEVTSPNEWGANKNAEKFFCTFPYPYMNGRLHLGHAFTVTKAEFQARFQRLLGKQVLWPFAFHCTGMPIAACADKLKREVAEMNAPEEEEQEAPEEQAAAQPDQSGDVQMKAAGKFSGKKSKAVAKTGAAKKQWAIMQSMDVPEEEIPKFADARHWLQYFPPLAKEDLIKFGMAVDWRRSFITTDENPYYDAFIRWQFNTLKARGRLAFGKRHTIFSRIDGQPCADHDRASGEGVNPQEYTLIKLKVQTLPDSWPAEWKAALGDRPLYMVAATLRPETMYGQTNCFVLPEGTYGAFVTADGKEAFLCSRRSAVNMGYQGIVRMVDGAADSALRDKDGKPLPEAECLFEVAGQKLIGLPLSAPNCPFPTVYALPMPTISMDKGTGVVTSVPSDAPDDYAMLRDLQEKAALRAQYGVEEAWVKPFDVVEIIDIPGYGRQAAVKLVVEKKIASHKDKAKLTEAKQEVYLKGFYEGVMLVGSQTGKKVCDAKNAVRQELVDRNEALTYFEPEKQVISRSGDECVVALCDQWYLKYGEEAWRKGLEAHVNDPAKFNAFNPVALHQFQHVLDWLREWACSRNYGLGTRLPWDHHVVIESLSDSTIYMAYYTIAHLLQGGDLTGKKTGPLGITPEQLTDDVFDYVFLQSEVPPAKSGIPKDTLEELRREFSYWYPMDLRVSGKDLIPNHLTMSLYNHAAIWETRPDLWPRGFFCNGHVMVDAEKMSKSQGNFLTLKQSIEQFTSDGTRLACADAGDSLDDANYGRDTANAAIMKLFNLEAFIAEVLQSATLRTGAKQQCDLMFENEMALLLDEAKKAYLKMCYRDALKFSFYDFQGIRDTYRVHCGASDMHKDSIMQWIEYHMIILSPICPHLAEHVWSRLLKKGGLVVRQNWPEPAQPFDAMLHRQYLTLMGSVSDFRSAKDKAAQAAQKAKAKGKGAAPAGDELPPNRAVVYVAQDYLELQQRVLRVLQTIPLDANNEPPKDFIALVKGHPDLASLDGKGVKDALQFASFQIKEVKVRGASALELRLPFDEGALMRDHAEFICRSLGVEALEVLPSSGAAHPQDTTSRRETAVPSKPVISFFRA